ncbi:hypothetical protein C2G38_2235434 [Gigaspora rosea]|uniref:Uncharacterized protein n=1 Tax=Gigaspora rosea TaxID=44941 RepID=A0A397TQ99_9GLOM|nr:hypothetical protein C2G38_2235434 [Gigaspora rosea]
MQTVLYGDEKPNTCIDKNIQNFNFYIRSGPVRPHLQVVCPSILFDKIVDIETPTGKTTIRNLFVSLFYHETLELYQLLMIYSNLTQRPSKPDLRSIPFTSRGYATVKHSNSNYTSDEKAINHTIGTLYNSVFCLSIYHVLHYAKNCRQISNYGNPLAILSNEKNLANKTFSHYNLLKLVIMLFRWTSIS